MFMCLGSHALLQAVVAFVHASLICLFKHLPSPLRALVFGGPRVQQKLRWSEGTIRNCTRTTFSYFVFFRVRHADDQRSLKTQSRERSPTHLRTLLIFSLVHMPSTLADR